MLLGTQAVVPKKKAPQWRTWAVFVDARRGQGSGLAPFPDSPIPMTPTTRCPTFCWQEVLSGGLLALPSPGDGVVLVSLPGRQFGVTLLPDSSCSLLWDTTKGPMPPLH